MTDQCDTCFCYKAIDGTTGRCHRHAPTTDPTSLAQWPTVYSTQWCGDGVSSGEPYHSFNPMIVPATLPP